MTRCIQIAAGILVTCVRDARAVIAPLLRRAGRDAAVAMLSVFMGITTAHAGVIAFNDVIIGATVYNFDAHGDGAADFRFSTTDPFGFNTFGPGPNMTYIQEPGLEGTSLLPIDLRIDFLSGGTNSLKFGFALNSVGVTGAVSATVYDKSGAVLASKSVVGQFTTTPGGQSSYPEGELSLNFAKTASYATLNFTSDFGRYIIDDVTIGAASQTVYLDFGFNASAEFASINAADFGVTPEEKIYQKLAATLGTGGALTSSQIDQIVQKLNEDIYSDYLVDFTATKPSSGDFSTIYIGGTTVPGSTINLPGATTFTAGVSQMRDYGNQNKNDSAVVFSGLQVFTGSIAGLEQVIAHETAHLLGLAHVFDDEQLLWPVTPNSTEAPDRMAIGGLTSVTKDKIFPPQEHPSLKQDSSGLLYCFVGSRLLGDYACTDTALESYAALALKRGTSLSSTIYDAKLVLANGDEDAGATVFDLGTLTPGQGAGLNLPRIPGLQGFFMGSSIAGGPIDIFSGNSGDPADYATFAQELIDSSGNLAVGDVALFQFAGGVFNPLGEISISVIPEPGSLWLMLGVLAWLLYWHAAAGAGRRNPGRRP